MCTYKRQTYILKVRGSSGVLLSLFRKKNDGRNFLPLVVVAVVLVTACFKLLLTQNKNPSQCFFFLTFCIFRLLVGAWIKMLTFMLMKAKQTTCQGIQFLLAMFLTVKCVRPVPSVKSSSPALVFHLYSPFTTFLMTSCCGFDLTVI